MRILGRSSLPIIAAVNGLVFAVLISLRIYARCPAQETEQDTQTIRLPHECVPIAISGVVGDHMYLSSVQLSNVNQGVLFIVRIDPLRVVGSVRQVSKPGFVACSPDHLKLFFTAYNDSSLMILDPKEEELGDQIKVGESLAGLSVSSDNQQAIVCESKRNILYFYNLRSRKIEAEVPLSGPGWRSLLNRDETKVYVATMKGYNDNQTQGSIDVISMKSRKLIKSIRVPGRFVWSLALSRDGSWLYAVSNDPGRLFVIDANIDVLDPKHPSGLEIGPLGYDVVLDGDRPWAYVGATGGDKGKQTIVVDVEKLVTIGTIPHGAGMMSVVERKQGGHLLLIPGDEIDEKVGGSVGTLTSVDLDKLEKRIKEQASMQKEKPVDRLPKVEE